MPVIDVTDPDDPRIAAYRDVRERDLTGRRGLFIGEGEVVLRALLAPGSRSRPVSVLLGVGGRTERLTALVDAASPDTPVYLCDRRVLDAVAGFALHRGVLALAPKPEPPSVDDLLAGSPSDALVLVAAQVGNHDNIGGLFRNAAAFGVDAVLLDDRCADPFYRKAVRVSVGGVLSMPQAKPAPLAELLDALDRHGFEVLALSPSGQRGLDEIGLAGRQAVLVGAEGPGLSPEALARTRPVSIPMARGFDSLNVATAAAIVLERLARRDRSPFA